MLQCHGSDLSAEQENKSNEHQAAEIGLSDSDPSIVSRQKNIVFKTTEGNAVMPTLSTSLEYLKYIGADGTADATREEMDLQGAHASD